MNTNRVGQRAFRIALLVSLSATLLSLTVLFFAEYRRKTAVVDQEIRTLREVQLSGIVKGLWDFDTKLIQALLDGMRFYPYVNYVAVESREGLVISSGAPKEGSARATYPLRYREQGAKEIPLGNLVLEIDSHQVLSDVLYQVFVSIFFLVLFFIVQSLIVLFLFSRMVTRHLGRIAGYIRTVDIELSAPPLALQKKHRGDELDILVQSFNDMRENLRAARESEIRAMDDLRISEARNRVLIDEAPDAIMIYDFTQGCIVSCNRRAESLLARAHDELIGMKPEQLYTLDQPDGRPLEVSVPENISRVLSGETLKLRRRIFTPDGRILECEVYLVRLPSQGQPMIRLSVLDISDRIKAEAEVIKSLREKEVLLQEVYHRTKNNMQLIAAFLNMEAMTCGEERASAILMDMIARINSMALVHQKLYESKDLSRIDLGDYLRDLVAEIRAAYCKGDSRISILVEAPKGIVSLFDTAVPCGLAVNELIINALKYAFPQARGGTIRVSLTRGGPGTLHISILDDGIGFPEGFDFRADGKIGLQTVISLVEIQLHGILTCVSGPGTQWTIAIRDDIYGERV